MLTLLLIAAGLPEGTSRVDFFGYEDCVALENETTRVVLCHQAGGRVLEYALNGENAIYLNPKAAGSRPGDERVDMTGGRFDIGPELMVPKRPTLWSGAWTAEITGPRTAVLTSQKDDATGVRLTRTFKLNADSSRLDVTQTIRNVSDAAKEYCHWSRTFAVWQGVVVMPLSDHSKMPNGYVLYETGSLIEGRPEDPNVRRRDGFLEVLGPPRRPKLGMDSREGWFSYLAPNDLLFTKSYAVDPDVARNELAGLTISIWYPDGPMVELEPIGPRQRIEPGGEASFTEVWHLSAYDFPEDRRPDLAAVAEEAERARSVSE